MNATNICPDPERLRAFLLGLLPVAEVDGLEAHVGRCSSCSRALEGLNTEDDFVQAVHQGLDAEATLVTAPDDLLIAQLCRLWGSSASDRADDTVLEPDPAAMAIPGYQVLHRLGTGGMGVVYKAQQRGLNRLVALKMIRSGAGADAEQQARFRREAQAVARLRHPHIVQVYEVGSCAGRPYLALEYLEGGTLSQQLAAGPRPARAAAELVATLAGAVEAAHAQGVLHRDLKPANVLLTADGLPKVADFGLAKWLPGHGEEATLPPSHHTQSGALLGTPNYMAPEQTLGADVGPAADVYALGAILYEVLTGRPPFQGPTVLDTLDQVRTCEPLPPRRLQPSVPVDLETICLKCLEKEPQRRYGSALALAEDLHRFGRGEPILARRISTWERLRKWARRRPATAALVTVSALALLGLVGGVVAHQLLLQEEVRRAEAGETAARKQQQRADANYRRTREALRRILHHLEERDLVAVPQLLELQRLQLEDALTFYQQTLQELDHADAAVREDAAETYRAVAQIQQQLGRREQARTNFRKAGELWQQLARESPGALRFRGQVAACWSGLAINSPNWEQGEPFLRKAHQRWLELLRVEPQVSEWQHGLAENYLLLGTMCQQTGRSKEALGHYERAAELYRLLVQQRPDKARYLIPAARVHNNVGILCSFSQQPARAEAAFRAAETLLQPVVRDQPHALESAVVLATVYQSWGNLYRLTGKNEKALERLTRAQQALDEVLRREPQHATARQALCNVHGARAMILQDRLRYQAAAREWDRVVELAGAADRYPYRMNRALMLALAGEHIRAAAEVEELAAKIPLNCRQAPLRLAQALAQCIPAVKASGSPPSERTALAERYGTRAVALLRQGHVAGLFKDRSQLKTLRSNFLLGPLRARADFQQLLRDVNGTK